MRLRGRSLGASGEGLREAARALLAGRFREGVLGRRRLEARLAFWEGTFSRRFRFLRRRRGGVDVRGVKSRASDVTKVSVTLSIPFPVVASGLYQLRS